MNKLHRLIDMTTASYENFEFYKVFREVYEFCVVEMSSFYFDILATGSIPSARNGGTPVCPDRLK